MPTRLLTAALADEADLIAGYSRPNSLIGLMGHSMLDQALQVISTGVPFDLRSIATWVAVLSNGRYRFPVSCKAAVSGHTSTQMVSTALVLNTTTFNAAMDGKTQLQAMVECAASTVLIHCAHNDFNGTIANAAAANTAFATCRDNHITAINALRAAGKRVLVFTDLPSGDATFTSARYGTYNLMAATRFRQWVLQESWKIDPKCVVPVDVWRPLANPTPSQVGDMLAGTTQEGVHPNSYGAYLVASQAVVPALDSLGIPAFPPALGISGESYDATGAPNANLVSNLQDSGSAPTLTGVTFTGNRPSNWSWNAQALIAAGSLTVAQTYGSRNGLPFIQVAITGNPGGSAGGNTAPYLYLQNTLTQANLTAGDTLSHSGVCEIDKNSTGIVTADLTLWRTGSAASTTNATFAGGVGSGLASSSRGSGLLDSILAQQALTLVYPDTYYQTVQSGDTTTNLWWRIFFAPGVTVNATLRLYGPTVRKVPTKV